MRLKNDPREFRCTPANIAGIAENISVTLLTFAFFSLLLALESDEC
jgi:hypothetical protein